MKTLRVLYQMARADFLERVRRYGFLMMLGLVVWLGYLAASGQMRMRIPPDYIGIVNSAWVGGTMTVAVSFLLGWAGFYIVKGSVNRDYETGVGQIMATTPLSRPLYMLGKWLSNFAVLGVAVLIMLIEGIAMNLLLGTEGLDLIALAAPLVIIALPCVGLIAALAVLFESLSWLRGGFGNVVYFFAFLFALVASGEITSVGMPGFTINPYIDFSGWQIVGDSVSHAAQAVYPESTGGFTFSITQLDAPKLFLWNGIDWTTDIYLSRLFFLAVAVGLVMVAALFFDRFNSSRPLLVKQMKTTSISPEPAPVSERIPVSSIHLTPLAMARTSFHFGALFIAELKLFIKGQPWWWYVVALGLVIAQLSSDIEATRVLLLVAWVWHILILSGLGCRENRFNTRQIVFAAPHPILNQLPAAWLSAFIVTALLGSGALVKFIFMGETFSILGWLTGTLFIPSLALVLGTLTGSGKLFEVLYVFWMYILTQKVPFFDFVGMTSESPLYVYAPLAVGLFAFAMFARHWQLKCR
jgi:ABC-type transport system involved in multi-copper enzyme maturation permease subunit